MIAVVKTLHLALPAPISTNHLFANAGDKGRVKTAAYKEWVSLALQMIAAQPRRRYHDPVRITLYVGTEGVGNMDSDNALKAPLDALKKSGVIHDDSRKFVLGCESIWVPNMAGMVVEVRHAPPPPAAADIVSLVQPAMQDFMI